MPVDKVFVVGIIGNVTSFLVYASPIPTFSIICRKKSTEMFSVVPYVFSLLTAFLGLYYGAMKSGAGMLIMTVNGIGCIFEISYIVMFYMYTTRNTRRKIWKLIIIEVIFTSCLVGTTYFATHGKLRVIVIGSISSAIAIAMYASPLSIMRMVIRTKNVEAMPLTLTIFLLINGSIWSGFAFLTKDIFIGIPSVAGSICATGQILLYVVVRMKRDKQNAEKNSKPQPIQSKEHIIDLNGEVNGQKAAVNGQKALVNGYNGLVVDLVNGRHKSLRTKHGSLINGLVRTSSGKVLDLLKELPVGFDAYRTGSGKICSTNDDVLRSVELAKE